MHDLEGTKGIIIAAATLCGAIAALLRAYLPYFKEYRKRQKEKQISQYVQSPEGKKQVSNALVIGVTSKGSAKAYSYEALEKASGVITDTVGDTPIAVLYDTQIKAASAFHTVLNGRRLHFHRHNRGGTSIFIDDETLSEWTSEGKAIDGVLKGQSLEPFNVVRSDRAAWLASYPQTEVLDEPVEVEGVKPLTKPSFRKLFPAYVLLALFVLVVVLNQLPDRTPLSQRLTTKAWAAFSKGQETYLREANVDRAAFEKAVDTAELVITNYVGQARVRQQELIRNRVPLPPVGTVPENERRPIFQEGLVNDVGTCYFIKGRSLEYLSHVDEAKVAYQGATNFPHARTWDPAIRLFWSPSDASLGRLDTLK